MRVRRTLAVLVALFAIALGGWWLFAPRPSIPSSMASPAHPLATQPSSSPEAAAPRAHAAPVRLSGATSKPDPQASSGTFAGRVLSLGTGEGVATADLTFDSEGTASSAR